MMFSLTGESGGTFQVEDEPFDSGDGQWRLYHCRDHSGREHVAKLYATPVSDPQAIARVRSVIARGASSGTPGSTAETSINFPVDLLLDGPSLIGVVLPVVPSEFQRRDGRLRTFDELCSTSVNPPSASFRVDVAIRIAEIFAVLDGYGIVHGDVSARNLAWRPDRPDAYLVNVDGLTSPSDPNRDRYALAVLLHRGLLLDQGSLSIPPDLDPRLRALFDRAFADPYAAQGRANPYATGSSPTAAEWRDALREVYFSENGTVRRQESLEVLERHARQFRNEAPLPSGPTPYVPPAASPWPGPAQTPGSALPPGAAQPFGSAQPPTPPYGPSGFPPVYPAPVRRSSSSTGTIIAIALLAPVLAIGLIVVAAVALNGHHSSSNVAVTNAPLPDPTTTDPNPSPTTPEPDPTTSLPEPDPTTSLYQPPPPPPKYYYGAIAVGHDGSLGKAWDYDTSSGADKRAIDECPRSDCKVLVDFVNACGAIAYNPDTNLYWGGRGDTQTEAERNAISNAGGGHWITWVCTTR